MTNGRQPLDGGRPGANGRHDGRGPHRRQPTVNEILANLPEGVAEQCASAVDPLEVAAVLETAGISGRVAFVQYGRTDVFSLARELYGATTRRAVAAEREAGPRPGGPRNLVRGFLFALPAFVLATAGRELHLRLAVWVVPFALTCAWAAGQAIAAASHALLARGASADQVVVWALIASASLTGALGLTGVALLGGSLEGIALASVLATYVAASAVLLLRDELAAMAIAVAPGTVVSALYWSHLTGTLPREVAVAAVAGTAAINVGAALRHATRKWWRPPALSRTETAGVLRHLAYGVGCGLLVSIVVVGSASQAGVIHTGRTPRPSYAWLAAYPIVATLGVMEWQLRSYRARAHAAAQATHMQEFARHVWRAFGRSLGWYLLALLLASAGTATLGSIRGTGPSVVLMVTVIAIGTVFFVALVLVSASGVDAVLHSWALALGGYGLGAGLSLVVTGSFDATASQVSGAVAAVIALAALAFGVRQAVPSPFSYL